MDVGKDVRRGKDLRKLADVAYKDFISGYFHDNVDKMYETMDLIRENAPVQWMKLNIELMKLGMGREQNINININRQQDREALQGLVKARLTLPESGTYTPFEEIRGQKEVVETKKEDG